FEIVFQIGTGCAQRRTAAQRGNLAALSAVNANIEVMLIVDLIIDASDAIVAISEFGNRTEEVIQRCRKILDRTRPGSGPKTTRGIGATCRNLAGGKAACEIPQRVARRQTYRNTVGCQNGARICDPGCGWFCSDA